MHMRKQTIQGELERLKCQRFVTDCTPQSQARPTLWLVHTMTEVPPAPASSHRGPAWAATRPESTPAADLSAEGPELVARMQRLVGFNPRQLQPTWVETGLTRRLQRLEGMQISEYLKHLDENPGEANQLLEQWLEPAAWSGPDSTMALRAPTRTLLDGLLRQRTNGASLSAWVLAPGCEAILDHLRLRLQSAGQSPVCCRCRGRGKGAVPARHACAACWIGWSRPPPTATPPERGIPPAPLRPRSHRERI